MSFTSNAKLAMSIFGLVASCELARAETTLTSIKFSGSTPYIEKSECHLTGCTKKIVGGIGAKVGELPWQVSIGASWIASVSDAHFCGGSILQENWIVTAAHCVDGNTPTDIIVSAGAVDLAEPMQRRNVKRIIVKDGYSSANTGQDIALLELLSPLELNDTTKSIGLSALSETSLLGATLLTSGFGHTSEGGEKSAQLNLVEVPFVDREKCNEPLSYDGRITSDMICAGLAEGGKDSCQGDSGGPLVNRAKTPPELVGIVSWGEGCARPVKYGIYSSIGVLGDWVKACIEGKECPSK